MLMDHVQYYDARRSQSILAQCYLHGSLNHICQLFRSTQGHYDCLKSIWKRKQLVYRKMNLEDSIEMDNTSSTKKRLRRRTSFAGILEALPSPILYRKHPTFPSLFWSNLTATQYGRSAWEILKVQGQKILKTYLAQSPKHPKIKEIEFCVEKDPFCSGSGHWWNTTRHIGRKQKQH